LGFNFGEFLLHRLSGSKQIPLLRQLMLQAAAAGTGRIASDTSYARRALPVLLGQPSHRDLKPEPNSSSPVGY